MAKIGEGTLKVWQDGQDVDAVDINRNFEVLRVANNNTDEVANTATNTLDSKVGAVQNDLNTKYTALTQADEILETTLTETSEILQTNITQGDEAVRAEFKAADADLQTQVNEKISAAETDSRISAAISTVVAGNAVIPSGAQFPPVGEGRIEGEEFILIGGGGIRTLYFYNVDLGMWVQATQYIPLPSASITTKGVVQLTEDTSGTSSVLVPNQKAVNDHVNNTVVHMTQEQKDKLANALSKDGGTINGNLTVKAPNLGTTVGSTVQISSNEISTTSNLVKMSTRAVRLEAGTSWEGVAIDLRRTVDSSDQAVLRFFRDDIQFLDSSNVWTSLRDLKSSVSNGKAQVAAAITGKGQTTAADATFATMANNINNISTDPKIVNGNLGTGIVTAQVNTTQNYSLPGVTKTPVAFKLTLSDLTYQNQSNITTSYSVNNTEFVTNMTGRSLGVTGTSFDLVISISGNTLSVKVQNLTSVTNSIRYSIGAFTAIY